MLGTTLVRQKAKLYFSAFASPSAASYPKGPEATGPKKKSKFSRNGRENTRSQTSEMKAYH